MKHYKIWIEGIVGSENQVRSYENEEQARAAFEELAGGAADICLFVEEDRYGSLTLDIYKTDTVCWDDNGELVEAEHTFNNGAGE